MALLCDIMRTKEKIKKSYIYILKIPEKSYII